MGFDTNKELAKTAGRKGGLAKGSQKSWLLKLTLEERNARMEKVRAARKKK